MFITNDIKYIGVNDYKIDLFEGQYIVPNGMSYNSYVIIDEKIAVFGAAAVPAALAAETHFRPHLCHAVAAAVAAVLCGLLPGGSHAPDAPVCDLCPTHPMEGHRPGVVCRVCGHPCLVFPAAPPQSIYPDHHCISRRTD